MSTWTPPAGTEALIFDCDGTLADTMPLHYRAWVRMLDRYGIVMPESQFYSFGGMPTSKIIRILSDESGVAVPDVEAMLEAKEAMFLGMLADVQPVPGVHAIAAAHREQLPMAVASGGYRRIVEQTLAHIGVKSWMGAIVCAEDTVLHKPEPDVFLEAARRLGANPARCVAFEDTDIGMESIRRAGMTAIDIRPWLPDGHGGKHVPPAKR
jgi:HAD superfamily hydrolase (TIGR01509 family)